MPSAIQELPGTLDRTKRGIASVAICVATYHRADGITRLLQGLEKLEFNVSPRTSVTVIVVDNDPISGIGAQVGRMFLDSPLKITVIGEHRPGISFARNRAVQEAILLGVDAIAFIDDDETPDPGWLDALLQVQSMSGAEAVAGPVVPHFEASAPEWLIQGKFFSRPRHASGSSVDTAPTCNLLILANAFKNLGLWFDIRFGLSGGEDTLLTLQLRRMGGRIVWADEAIVSEWIPQDRCTAQYILKRAFSNGSTWARVERQIKPEFWVRLQRGASGAAKIAAGFLLLLPSVLIGRHAVVRSAAKASLGLGMLSGLLGFRSRFYGPSRV